MTVFLCDLYVVTRHKCKSPAEFFTAEKRALLPFGAAEEAPWIYRCGAGRNLRRGSAMQCTVAQNVRRYGEEALAGGTDGCHAQDWR